MTANFKDFKVKIILFKADFGRQEILLAQDEMPALMQLRNKYREEQPQKRCEDYGMYTHDHPNSSSH